MVKSNIYWTLTASQVVYKYNKWQKIFQWKNKHGSCPNGAENVLSKTDNQQDSKKTKKYNYRFLDSYAFLIFIWIIKNMWKLLSTA